jgi:hypothetical protein
MKVLFIGEARSERAKQMDVRWEDKALASRTLHDALTTFAVPIKPTFINIATPGAFKVISEWKGPRVGMGKIVQSWLAKRGLTHLRLIHPAARGAIRAKAVYAQHLRTVLRPLLDTVRTL